MIRGIEIQSDVDPLNIYTVSYTPRLSNTYVEPSNTSLLNVVDLTGDQNIRMVTNNVLTFSETKRGFKVASADIYLMILMRRNSANLNVSPILQDYLLVFGSKNQNKYNKEY
jgi:hypothetical protein